MKTKINEILSRSFAVRQKTDKMVAGEGSLWPEERKFFKKHMWKLSS